LKAAASVRQAAAVTCIELDDPPCRVRLIRSPRARRFTLRLETCGTGAVLTVPPDVPAAESRRFLARHSGWLRAALARQPDATVVAPGVELPIGGVPVPIIGRAGPRRPPCLQGGVLVLQGAGAEGQRIAAWLKMRARDALLPAARGYARRLGREISEITLRDTRSRWGSCSSRGALSFSWRLAMAPPAVLDYVAAHEAAHLVEMNHSPRYWALLESLLPGHARHRAWLKREGRRLHAFRFSAE
jgi:predicted metal-dependent hydrolase